MADDKLTENDGDEDLEIVEVETLPRPGEEAKASADDADDDEEEASADDADDEEDSRLAADDGEDEEEADPKEDSAARKKRVKRRTIQKQARDRTLQEVSFLRQQNQEFQQRLAQLEGFTRDSSEATVDTRLSEVRRSIAEADRIHAAAIDAQNGADAVEALRLRDEYKTEEFKLLNVKDSIKATPAYWQELSRRVGAAFQQSAKPAAKREAAAPAPGKKTAPPQGQSREHAPQSTRKEVYVTPERKQAMIDGGLWDDLKERAATLKAYAQYDRDQSANR